MYRSSPDTFRTALAEAAAVRPDEVVLRVWVARLSEPPRNTLAAGRLGPAVVIALCCGLLVRLPAIWFGEDWYYPRFMPSIGLLGAAVYFWVLDRHRLHGILGRETVKFYVLDRQFIP